MKKLLVAVVGLACATVAFATGYTWSGGSTGNWTDSANWGGGGYPSSNADTATFTKSVDVTIASVVDVHMITAQSGATVTLTGSGDGKIRISGTGIGGLNAAAPTDTIIVSVPVEITGGRQDTQGNGTVKFLNATYSGKGSFDSYNRAKTQIFSTGSLLDFSSKTGGALALALGVADATVTFEEDAVVKLPGVSLFNGSSAAQNFTIYQKGTSSVTVSGNLVLNGQGTTTDKKALYYLQDNATLTVGYELIPMSVAGGTAEFHQQGGTSTLGGVSTGYGSSIYLEGGTMYITGSNGKLLHGGGKFEVCGGNLVFKPGAAIDSGFTVRWNGQGTVTKEEGANLGNLVLALTKGYYTQEQIDSLKTTLGVKEVKLDGAALVGEYAWTGDGDGSSWSDPENWGMEAGAPYPGKSGAAEDAKVTIGRNADIVVDVNEELNLRRIYLQGVNLNVSILRKEGSSGSFKFAHGYEGYGAGLDGSSDTSTLTIDVPLHAAKRTDTNGIKVIYKGRMTVADKQMWYMHAKSNVYADGAEIDMANITGPSFGMGSNLSFFFNEGAVFKLMNFTLCDGSTGSNNNLVEQNGATVDVSGNFYVNQAAFGKDGHRYTLKDGTLTIGTQMLVTGPDLRTVEKINDTDTRVNGKGAGDGMFVQKGGTVTTPAVTLNYGDIFIEGGDFSINGNVLQGVNPQGVPGTFNMSGGTLNLGSKANVQVPINVTGGTIALADGATFSGNGVLNVADAEDLSLKLGKSSSWSALGLVGTPDRIRLFADTAVTVTTDGPLPAIVDLNANVTLVVAEAAHAAGCTIRENGGAAQGALSQATLALTEAETPLALGDLATIAAERSAAKVILDGPALKLGQDYDWSALRGYFLDTVNLVSDGDTLRKVTVKAETALPQALTISNNVSVLTAKGVDLVPDGKGTIPALTINDGGSLVLYSQGSHLLVPIHLAINGSGYLHFGKSDYARTAIVAYSYTLNGVKQGHGKYSVKTNDSGPLRATLDTNQLFVPFVWTGKGDGKTMSDTANWLDGVWSTYSTDPSCDFSQATGPITVDGDYTYGGITYLPTKAGQTLTLNLATGAKLNVKASGSYYPVVVCRKGCTIDVNVDFVLATTVSCQGLVGGGTIVFKRGTGNFMASNDGPFLIDGRVVIAGTVTGGNYLRWSPNHNCDGAMSFASGATVTLNKALTMDMSGFLSAAGYTQDGGTVTAPYIGVFTARSDGMNQCFYTLNGGTLNATEALLVGESTPTGYHMATTSPTAKGTFTMNGGTLNAKGIAVLCNNNFCNLLGGVVNLGSGGFYKGSCTVRTPNASSPVVLGDVTINATDSFALAAELTAAGYAGVQLLGDATLNVPAGKTVTLNGRIEGSGSLTVAGGGKVSVAGCTCSATGGIVLGGGATVVLDAGDVINASVFKVASEEALKTVTFEGGSRLHMLYIGGKRKYGTFETANGTIEVVPAAGFSVWTGEAGDGKWSTAGNWLGETLPVADADVLFETEAEVTIDAAVSVTGIAAYQDLTLKGTGPLTVRGGGILEVSDEKTLTLEVEVRMPDGQQKIKGVQERVVATVSKKGRGLLKVMGTLTSGDFESHETGGTGADANDYPFNCHCLAVQEGQASFFGTVSGVGVFGLGVDAAEANWPVLTLEDGCQVKDFGEVVPARGTSKCYGKVVQKNATVDHANANFCMMSVRGGEGVYVVEGGTLDVTGQTISFDYTSGNYETGKMTIIQNGGEVICSGFNMFRQLIDGAGNYCNRYVLNGGTLHGFATGAKNNEPEKHYDQYSRLELNGGVYDVGSNDKLANEQAAYTVIGGPVTVMNAKDTLAFPPEGAIAFGPNAAITFAGAGTLDATSAPCLKAWGVTGGTLRLGEGQLDGDAVLTAGANGKFDLAYEGSKTIGQLFFGTRQKARGRDYGVGKAGASRFAGTGAVNPSEGPDASGAVILLR